MCHVFFCVKQDTGVAHSAHAMAKGDPAQTTSGITNLYQLTQEERQHLFDHLKEVKEVAVTIMYTNGTSLLSDNVEKLVFVLLSFFVFFRVLVQIFSLSDLSPKCFLFQPFERKFAGSSQKMFFLHLTGNRQCEKLCRCFSQFSRLRDLLPVDEKRTQQENYR